MEPEKDSIQAIPVDGKDLIVLTQEMDNDNISFVQGSLVTKYENKLNCIKEDLENQLKAEKKNARHRLLTIIIAIAAVGVIVMVLIYLIIGYLIPSSYLNLQFVPYLIVLIGTLIGIISVTLQYLEKVNELDRNMKEQCDVGEQRGTDQFVDNITKLHILEKERKEHNLVALKQRQDQELAANKQKQELEIERLRQETERQRIDAVREHIKNMPGSSVTQEIIGDTLKKTETQKEKD